MKNTVNNILGVIILFAFGSTCLMGCDKKSAPPPPTPQVNQPVNSPPPVQQVASTAKVPPASGLQVNFLNQKDPFKPLITPSKKGTAVRKNRLGQALPILNYEVSEFKVSGIIVGLKQNTALIIDPTGKPYVVKAGMDIGRNDGRITKIASNYIEVLEQFRDENGKLLKKATRLTLPKKE